MGLFSRKEPARIALIDICAGEVAFGYAYKEESGIVDICFASSLPIEQRQGEDVSVSLERTISMACTQLITEGAPALKNIAGSGKADSIVIQLSGPWQRTTITRTVSAFDAAETVTRSLIARTIAEGRSREHEDDLMEETVLSTTLNGYSVKDPIGKQARSIACMVMRSFAPQALQSRVKELVRAQFHSTPITIVAKESTLLISVRSIAPFHTDMCILDIDQYSTTLLLIQEDAPVASVFISHGTCSLLEGVKHAQANQGNALTTESDAEHNARFAQIAATAQSAWAESLCEKMRDGLKPFVMPHTVFVVSHADSRDFLIRMLQQAPLRSLWVGDVEPVLTPLLQTAFTARASFSTGEPDLGLTMLALRYLTY